MKKWMRLLVVMASAFMLVLPGCGSGNSDGEKDRDSVRESDGEENSDSAGAQDGQTHHVKITVKDYGTISVELDGEAAPVTVENFIRLASEGFYDGLTFHRIISGFMIQGGDPAGVGTGGPGYTIKGEFALNGFKQNDIKHVRGVLSMARAMNPNSAGSQFFIMHQNAAYLDGQYAAFGRVTDGMSVVDEIAAVKTDPNDKPRIPQIMKKVTVDTFGVSYPKPIKF